MVDAKGALPRFSEPNELCDVGVCLVIGTDVASVRFLGFTVDGAALDEVVQFTHRLSPVP
jgi:hypothetical protein